MRRVLALSAALAASFPLAAHATTAADLCGAAADPCVVSSSIVLTPGSLIDLGARALVVKAAGVLDVGSGSATILGGSARLEPGAKLLAESAAGSGGEMIVTVTGDLLVQGDSTKQARVDASGTVAAGRIALTAGGTLQVEGLIDASSADTFADGGAIELRGAVVTVGTRGRVNSDGGVQAGGGDIALAGTVGVTMNGAISAEGGEGGGGSVLVDSGGNATVTGLLNVNGRRSDFGDGGFVEVFAQGDITLAGPISGRAIGNYLDGGGVGADVTAIAGGRILQSNEMQVTGAPPDGEGGDVELRAGGDLTQQGLINAIGNGTETCGGRVTFSGTDVGLASNIDVTGGNCGGGEVLADATGSLLVTGNVTADGTELDTVGGEIDMTAVNALEIRSRVHANAPVASAGGAISLSACSLTLTGTSEVESFGVFGQNLLRASGPMRVAGVLGAGTLNRLEFRDAATPPDLTGASIQPAAVVVQNPGLGACPATGAVCGNGTLEASEGCDDGNTDACDGCSATCRPEGCGNGRVECAEECDDGVLNGSPGDNCDLSCRRIASLLYAPGSTRGQIGCLLEWAVENADGPTTGGFPDSPQPCIDGDPGCDGDGASDGVCHFQVSACLAANDLRLPLCQPTGTKIVNVRRPNPIHPRDATDGANAMAVVNAVKALGVTVKTGDTFLQNGTTRVGRDQCTAPFTVLVPHAPGVSGERLIAAGATDAADRRLKTNRLRLQCLPNTAVCGNGTRELGEQCDDGNTASCDGCNAACRSEVCGDGILACAEECDEGPQNGAPGGTCTATCTEAPPPLRIPGGGSASSDCQIEWALRTGAPLLDRHGNPATVQVCTDGDPACDFDPRPGLCELRVFACVGAADTRLGCNATSVASFEVTRPSLRTGGPVRSALTAALGALPFPVGPGEVCSRRIDLPVTAGRRKLAFKVLTRDGSGAADRDRLKLGCVAP